MKEQTAVLPRPRTSSTLLGRSVRVDWLLVGVVLVAVALRLFRLHQVPAGFDTDEAFNMFDALRILDGDRPVFLPANAGREALYSYFQAAAVGLLGAQVTALRLTSALLGIATVPATYLLVRRMAFPQPRSVALLTATLLAISFYHLVFSRYGIRSISVPLFECLAFAAFWRGIREQGSKGAEEWGGGGAEERRSRGARGHVGEREGGNLWRSLRRSGALLSFVFAGVWLGLGVSAHPAGRITPFIPIAFSLYLAWRDRSRTRRYLIGLAIMLGVALVVFAPLGYYFWTNPWQFTSHPAEVTVVDFSSPAATLRAVAGNAVRVLGMFNVHGAEAWARNLSGRPVFDPLMGLFFLAGLLLLVRAIRRPSDELGEGDAAIFVFLWLGIMLLPTVLASPAPSFSRAIGVLPAVFIPPAMALLAAADYVRRRAGFGLARAGLATVLLISAAWTAADYFVVYANQPEMAYDYDQDKVDAAGYIRQFHDAGMRVFLSPFLADHPTVRFLTRDLGLSTFDGEKGLVLPPADAAQPAVYLFMPKWEPERAQNFAAQLGPAAEPEMILDEHDQPLLTVYKLGPRQLPQPAAPLAALRQLGYAPEPVPAGAFAEGVELAGYALDRPLTPGDTSRLTLFWRTEQPLSRDYTVFVHVVDDQQQRWAQHDGWPVGGSYRTSAWRPGDLIVDHHSLAVEPAASGPVCIQVGLYLLETGERLPLWDYADTHAELACGPLGSPDSASAGN